MGMVFMKGRGKKIPAQKMKFSIKNYFSKCDQIHSFLRIWLHLLMKSLMESLIFCAVITEFECKCYSKPTIKVPNYFQGCHLQRQTLSAYRIRQLVHIWPTLFSNRSMNCSRKLQVCLSICDLLLPPSIKELSQGRVGDVLCNDVQHKFLYIYFNGLA